MKDFTLHKAAEKEVKSGRVSVQRRDGLSIYKYTTDTHMQNLWNDINLQCRGLIISQDSDIVARPFSKFFNLGERESTKLHNLPRESYEIWEKLDGSCGIGYFWDDRWQLATPGSMESEQAIYGTRLLSQYDMSHMPQNVTPVFEIIYPANRLASQIVIDYGLSEFLSLLAIFELNGKEWHSDRVDYMATLCGFKRPKKYHSFDLRGDIPFESKLSEGFVIKFNSGMRVKIKDPRYIYAHRLMNHMSYKGVVELIRHNQYGTTINNLPKDIQKSFDDIRSFLQAKFDTYLYNIEHMYVEMQNNINIPAATRKECALWIRDNIPPGYKHFMFSKLDLDDERIHDNIWKALLEDLKKEQ